MAEEKKAPEVELDTDGVEEQSVEVADTQKEHRQIASDARHIITNLIK